MRYRVGFGGHTNVTMLDDGTTGGDEVAGDGVYTATIPAAGGAAAGEMVRWYIEAFDTDGHNSRWPLFQKSSGERQSEEYLGTVVADPAVTSQLSIYQLFVQNPSAADRRSGTRASMFYDGEFYDNVFIRERGNSSAALSKTNHRINFNRDHLFRADDSGYRFQKVNLQANMADPAYLRETLEAETFRRAGVPTIRAEQVRLEMNGNFFQLAGFVEHVDGDFLNRVGLDPNGALYKNPIMLNKFATSGRGPWSNAEKITRIDIDGPGKSDLRDLVYGIYEGNSDDDRARFILDNVDIPAAINYMASFHVTQEADSMHINVMVYRDSDGTGEWRWLPFDMNFSFGQWFAADFVTGNRDNHFGHPFYGAEGFEPDVRNYSFSRLQDAIISTPETRQMYLRRLRTLMDEFLQPPGTPAEDLYFESRLAEYQRAMQQDADLDRKINGHAFRQTSWTNLRPMTFSDGVQQIIRDYLVQRRTHLYVTHSIDNPAYDPSAPISEAMPAGIPHAQVGVPAINFGDLQYNPLSGNQDEEYIELVNPNATAVDLSGWQLTGGVDFAFQPGTVIPSGGTLYLSPNVTAFRARATGPSGGQRLFVQGGYSGHISNLGEVIELRTSDGSLVSTITTPSTPSEAQRFLRITEVNYNPTGPSEATEFIELKNVSDSTTLDLTGVRITKGPSSPFDFTDSNVTALAPGEFALVVNDAAAFTAVYPDVDQAIIAGEFNGGLSNGGERIKLEDADNGTILDFYYEDGNDPGEEAWHPETDGVGFTLVVVDELAANNAWEDGTGWRISSLLAGSPGADDPTPLPADLTANGFVDFQDLTILLVNWNQNVSAVQGNLVDEDTTPVNFQDLTVLLAAWTGPEPAKSPQPAATEAFVPRDTATTESRTATNAHFDRLGRRDRPAMRRAGWRNESPISKVNPLRRLQAAAVDRAMADQSTLGRERIIRRTAGSSARR
ncbi:MAG: CotH kinase family protein [Planctomycetes bacterium]|nr:CotH kinase family protein [Planctomycetota bacterium]